MTTQAFPKPVRLTIKGRPKNTLRIKGRTYYSTICTICNASYITRQIRGKVCSKKCHGILTSKNHTANKHPRWKGGKGNHKSGYIVVRIDKHKYVLEHRHIMELFLKRKLNSDEEVHHVNGIKTDNRIDNLKVLTKSEHKSLHARTNYDNKVSPIWKINHQYT